MYENMKAKDAAKIFDRLDLRILVEVVERHEPAPHVGHPRPDGSRKRPSGSPSSSRTAPAQIGRAPAAAAELPKIEGRPKS